MGYMAKRLFRSIWKTLGRYIAVMAIIGLGVGFYAGLKNSTPAMRGIATEYLEGCNFYDFQLISTLGMTEENVEELEQCGYSAEGGYTTEAMCNIKGYESSPLQILSLPKKIAVPKLVKGRLPEEVDECVVDASFLEEEDVNEAEPKELNIHSDNEYLGISTFKVVGLVNSPRYISIKRGITSLGNGELQGFVYVSPDAFVMPKSFMPKIPGLSVSEIEEVNPYHEILLNLHSGEKYFSEGYNRKIAKIKPVIETSLNKMAETRYNDIKAQTAKKINDLVKAGTSTSEEVAKELINKYLGEAPVYSAYFDFIQNLYNRGEEQITEKIIQEEIDKMIVEPTVYCLGLDTNYGCVQFELDTSIVSSIANVFPIFFALIAALVCGSTMMRMVAEERTQIGTMKSLGYSDFAISLKYLLYAGSAALIGSLIGYFMGTGIIPEIVWLVYKSTYNCFGSMSYCFDAVMYVVSTFVSIIGVLAVTFFACNKSMKDKPAMLIRPKAQVKGKRILMERIKPLWKRLPFLTKCSLRNAVRYKTRVIMMLIGVIGCTALVLAGFGMSDSLNSITVKQFDEICTYDGYAVYDENVDITEQIDNVLKEANEYCYGYRSIISIENNEKSEMITLSALKPNDAIKFFHLSYGKNDIEFPAGGGIVLSKQIAEKLALSKGDRAVCAINGEMKTLLVVNICDNYVGNCAYINFEKFEDILKTNAIWYSASSERVNEIAEELRAINGVNSVSTVEDEMSTVQRTLESLDYVFILIIICAAALLFIVLYNLTNINILERSREIATVKVLGFNLFETTRYILAENIIVSIIGALIGLPVGILLNNFILGNVTSAGVTFISTITPLSFLWAFLLTIGFAVVSSLFMLRKLKKVNMAESLKSVE